MVNPLCQHRNFRNRLFPSRFIPKICPSVLDGNKRAFQELRQGYVSFVVFDQALPVTRCDVIFICQVQEIGVDLTSEVTNENTIVIQFVEDVFLDQATTREDYDAIE